MMNDAQVRKLMREKTKTGLTGIAGLKAGMSRNTAAKYLKEGRLPSEMKEVRDWRTRPDPFLNHWAEMDMTIDEVRVCRKFPCQQLGLAEHTRPERRLKLAKASQMRTTN